MAEKAQAAARAAAEAGQFERAQQASYILVLFVAFDASWTHGVHSNF